MIEKNLLVLFGGRSTEHDISVKSVRNILKTVDTEEYTLLPVGITKDGQWLFVPDTEAIEKGVWEEKGAPCMLSPDSTRKSLFVFREGRWDEISVDVIFPVLHGLYGEDGTVQGLFELAGIPYIGCGVFSSACAMDKAYTKLVVSHSGIRQADFVLTNRDEIRDFDAVAARVEEKFSYPVFVKPSCAGSSVGVHKAENRAELESALTDAAANDYKVLIEETIVGRELECAVFDGGDGPVASGVGEILAAAEFYDFDAKYNSPESETDNHPVLPDGVEEEIREDARKIFRLLGCFGLSRVDFFYDGKNVIFNEINTLPGFTEISMYPKLFAEAGIDGKALTKKLIESAYHRKDH